MRHLEGDGNVIMDETKENDMEKPFDDELGKLEHFENVQNSVPDTKEYDSKGYHYKMNDYGQLLHAGGELRLEDGKRNNYAQRIAGGENRHEEDDGGHLIASRFGGSGELDNIVPEDKSVNRGGFKSLENEWARNLEDGNKVYVDIDPVYQNDSKRPILITGSYEIDDGNKKEKEYFSMTNENLESDEFSLPEDDLTDVYPNAMNYDRSKYEKEVY